MITKTLWFATVFTVVLTAPLPVLAAEGPSLPDDASGTVWVVSAPIVTLIAGLLIPILNGLLGKLGSKLVPIATVIFNGLVALFTTGRLEDGTAVFSEQMLLTWAIGFLISITSYYGIYKPYGVTNRDKLGTNGLY